MWHNVSSSVLRMLEVVTVNPHNGKDRYSVHVDQEGDESGRTHFTVERPF